MKFSRAEVVMAIFLSSVSCTDKEKSSNETIAGLDQAKNMMPGKFDLDSVNVIPRIEKVVKNPIQIGNLEIYPCDLEVKTLKHFDAKGAKEACNNLGDGWRLPDEGELQLILDHADALGEFGNTYYWGLTQDEETGEVDIYLRLNIVNGELLDNYQEEYSIYSVRPVRNR